ncbi:MAG: L-seryl-tRNA(Sec) selenium transferase [Verrucomicrobiales bacterium]
MSQANLRHVPSVEKIIAAMGEQLPLPRPMIADLVRTEVARVRERLLAGGAPQSFEGVTSVVREKLDRLARTRLQPVINGTGVIIHTNLGRAPLGIQAAARLRDIASGYCNLEYDLDGGDRGQRGLFVERLLALLCEAEAATVVNNCAAALVLVLRLFARHDRNEVIVSRGELVEIGGGFRVPEILETSGATLREVGTTNKTSLDDYQQAIGPRTALILKVHRSNFYLDGFTAEPGLSELAALARERSLPIVQDLGSGAIVSTDQCNRTRDHEPTPSETLRHGIDLVCFSGDKLFGGPQAGVIAGKGELIARLKKEPFFRALRCDKLILAALEVTAAEYLKGGLVAAVDDVIAGAPDAGRPASVLPAAQAHADVPVIQMLQTTTEELEDRAKRILSFLPPALGARQGHGISRCGGGTMPRSEIASVTLEIQPDGTSVDDFAARLRLSRPPVIGYVSDGVFKIDLRTVFPWQDEALTNALETSRDIHC